MVTDDNMDDILFLMEEKLYRKRPKQRHGPTSSKDDTSRNSDGEKDLTIYKKDYEDYFGSEKATMQTYVVVKSPFHFEASFTPLVPKQTMTTAKSQEQPTTPKPTNDEQHLYLLFCCLPWSFKSRNNV